MFFVHVTRLIDRFIEKQQLKAPESTAVADELLLSLKVPKLTEVDLLKQSISTVIWATGFKPNYSWIDLPVFDQAKTPIYHRGVTQVEGFYFLGLHRLYTLKSGSLFGVGEDAAFILKNIKSYFRVQKIIKTSNRMSCRKNSLVS